MYDDVNGREPQKGGQVNILLILLHGFEVWGFFVDCVELIWVFLLEG